MSIGVGFVLRATSAQFTRAMASANNSVKDLKKGLRDFDVGNGFKQALGVGGIIAGFRMAIRHAQELRDSMQEVGRGVDGSTASVARFGDALDSVFKSTKDGAVWLLSYFTNAGDGWGRFINRLRGISDEQQRTNERTEKAANDAQTSRDDAYKRAVQRSKTIDRDLEEQRKKTSAAGLDDEEKRNRLLKEREKLLSQIDRMPSYDESTEAGRAYNVARKVKQLEADKMTEEIGKLGLSLEKESIQIQERKNAAARQELKLAEESDKEYKEKLGEEVRAKFSPTVEQLARMSTGGFAEGDDPRLKAKQILEKERFAAEAAGRGDFKAAMALGTEAQGMRQSLEGITGGGTALTPASAEVALRNALDQTNKELVSLRESVKGMIRAQP